MAKFTHVNIDTTTNGATEIVFSLLTQMLAAGWTVQSSSDGTTYKSTPGSQVVSAAAGAGGLNNTNAWFRIQDPGARREFVLYRGINPHTWTFVYSPLARFTGGSPGATTRPTASDEQIIYSAVTLSSSTLGAVYGHVVVQSTPEGGVYGFWVWATVVGTGVFGQQSPLFCEPLTVGSYPSADVDPVVLWTTSSTSTITTTVGAWRWMYKLGLVGEAWTGIVPVVTPARGAAPLVAAIGTNPYDGDDNHLPVGFARLSSDSTQVGWKGWAKYLRAKGTNRSYPDTINLATDAYVHVGEFLLPWEDGTTPLV